MPGSSTPDALEIAAGVAQAFVAHRVTYKRQSIAATISADIACLRAAESTEQLPSRADRAPMRITSG
ncbi:MAG: hypothetical protein EPN74_10490 [Rhodanobacter sp.]|nr:MAG: hypothetical protein EPN74_10490 [Rhodanobacter sp.]